METPFEKVDGVDAVISGYTGGDEVDPSYQEVASGVTGHTEAIQIRFDPSKVTYAELLKRSNRRAKHQQRRTHLRCAETAH